jgi:hypothetical protein
MGRMNSQTFSMAQFGPRIGTRSEGEAARSAVLDALDRLPSDGQLLVSLDGLEVLSGSFADEAIGKAYQALVSGLHEGRTMIVQTPSLELTEGLADKLTQRRLAMLCLEKDRWHVLGQLAEPHRKTLDLIINRGSTTAKELAEALAIPPNACHQRLKRLVELRLVLQERTGGTAPKTQYLFHSIL